MVKPAELKYVRTDRNGTEIYEDWNCRRCGGWGGQRMWNYTGWTCYECGGTGRAVKPRIVKKYMPEYQAKLDAKRAEKAEKAHQEDVAFTRAHMDLVYKKFGFSADGVIYVMVEKNTYAIKDELKEAGARFMGAIRRWYFTEVNPKYETIKVGFDDLYETHDDVNYVIRDYPEKIVKDMMPKTDRSGSDYIGEIGKKLSGEGEVLKVNHWTQSGFGYYNDCVDRYCYTFLDLAGNILTWFTGKDMDMKVGEKVSFIGTVKEHSIYDGVKQTVLQRVKVTSLA